jgi:hypothetical protein
LKPAWANCFRDLISKKKKKSQKKGWWSGSRCRPEFKLQYCKKKKKNSNVSFHRNGKTNPKIQIEAQKPQITKATLSKKIKVRT